MNRREVTRQPKEYRAVRAPEPGPKALAELISEDIRDGEYAAAANAYFSVPSQSTRRLLDPNDSLALGNWLARNNRPRAALTVFQRHLRDYPIGPGAADAHAYAGLLQLHAFGEATAAYQHLVEALDSDPSSETEKLVRQALTEIAGRQKFQVKQRLH
jgi:hypothetical protein